MDYKNDYSQLQPYLYEGEQVRWTGRPVSANPLRRSDTFLLPFSILWCGFAVFWESTVLAINAPLMFKLWGIPFVVIGLYISVGRLLISSAKLKKTLYAVTDLRVIRVVGKTVDSLSGMQLGQMRVASNTDGTGTISFNNDIGTAASRFTFFNDTRFDELRSIEKPMEVQRMILDIIAVSQIPATR